ncbi:hypothetical protein HYFRA_00009920 [Hymenoscyphus fraxineus]|uniref:C3H1-type domain-containing protein n=1 Tax=Hymenoscyphus fraxineus TaxID=746836 RepID=A0A9N9L5S3_9HELO|nr:hypothetical protein HYFRA_00009920 [Hymenoscyphus fraxineus]
MALSEKTARVLDQVKSGLSMLYMVDYFTEDEWMSIDLCIHKGKYVFTNGPPRHILDMSDDGQGTATPIGLQPETIGSLRLTEGKGIGRGISPGTSAEEDALDSFGDPSPELSSPPSSPEEPTQTPDEKIISWADEVQKEEDHTFELSTEMSRPPPTPKPVEIIKESNRPLFTQEQLEEARALKDQFTRKPGSKKVSSAASHSLRGSSKWAPESAISGDHERHRVNQRARDVTDLQTTRKPSVRSLQDPKVARALASVVTSLQSKTLELQPEMVVVARADASKTSSLIMEVRAGDAIKVKKHVSGILYYGQNLRTGGIGQFSMNNVQQKIHREESAPSAASSYAASIPEPPPSEPETASVDLEGFEKNNAAQWSEPAAPKRARASRPPTKIGGLGVSRFASLEDEMASSSCTDSEHGLSREIAADAIVAIKDSGPRPMHAYVALPPGQEPRNIRDGKPTWGAIADYLPPSSVVTSPFMTGGTSVAEHSSQASVYEDSRVQSPAPMSPSIPTSPRPIRSGVSKAPEICPYWADGGCYKSDEECRYHHTVTEAGVAEKPKGSHLRPTRVREGGIQGSKWSRWDNPSHPARKPENQTFRPALGGHEWRVEEEKRNKEASERAESIKGVDEKTPSPLEGVLKEQPGKPPAWDRSGEVELVECVKAPSPLEGELKEQTAKPPAWDRSGEVELVESVKTPEVDADGWIIAAQQDLKQELGW